MLGKRKLRSEARALERRYHTSLQQLYGTPCPERITPEHFSRHIRELYRDDELVRLITTFGWVPRFCSCIGPAVQFISRMCVDGIQPQPPSLEDIAYTQQERQEIIDDFVINCRKSERLLKAFEQRAKCLLGQRIGKRWCNGVRYEWKYDNVLVTTVDGVHADVTAEMIHRYNVIWDAIERVESKISRDAFFACLSQHSGPESSVFRVQKHPLYERQCLRFIAMYMV